MIPSIDIENITTEKAEIAILKTLAYFDIFDYPLSEKEIKNFLSCSLNDSTFRLAMQKLIFHEIIFKPGEFYSLQNDLKKAKKRLQGNGQAQKLLPKASRIGAFLYRFPYVRGVAVSGSLSKNYADEEADIDFFIITKTNRLWIARTILHLFKKFTFLFGKQHYYCMNYFVDEEALIIQERNIYIATELVTLFPVAGFRAMNKFFEVNNWASEWFPGYMPEWDLNYFEKTSIFKKSAEWLFNWKMGDRFDNFLFAWTTRRWKKKEKKGHKNSSGRIMNLLTGKHFSKSNPEAFQEKIVELYESKVEELKSRLVIEK